MEHELDVIVIGWGKGGKTLAARLARAGRRVAMVEASQDMYGGTCINTGCVPTKALIHDAEVRTASGPDPEYFQIAVRRRDQLTAMMRRKNYDMLDELDSVALFTGHAGFLDAHTIEVGNDEHELRLSARHIVINTGALPSVPPIAGAHVGGRIHDSTTVQHAPLPGELVIVGGGYVGLEFASMFAQYGSRVTVLDRGARPLAREDADVAGHVAAALADAGVRLVSSASVTRIAQDEQRATVDYEIDGQRHRIGADAVLLALGRTPNIAKLNLAAAGIQVGERHHIVVDDYLRTTASNVYAVGDVNGGPQFTYVSLDDYRIVADQLLGEGRRSTADRGAVPRTLFTTPPLARVGLTEEQARARGLRISVAAADVAQVAAMPRPKIVGQTRGIIKFVVDADTDQVLGAALMHVDAQESINLVSMAMRHGITAAALRDGIYTHPSSTEALNEVLGKLS